VLGSKKAPLEGTVGMAEGASFEDLGILFSPGKTYVELFLLYFDIAIFCASSPLLQPLFLILQPQELRPS